MQIFEYELDKMVAKDDVAGFCCCFVKNIKLINNSVIKIAKITPEISKIKFLVEYNMICSYSLYISIKSGGIV